MQLRSISVLLCMLAVSCSTRTSPAPVENVTRAPSYVELTKSAPPKPVEATTPTSQSSSSMRALSNDNSGIKEVNTTTSKPALVAPASSTGATTGVAPDLSSTDGFMMPTAGQTDGYHKNTKGIDIYGSLGQDVYASNSGKVVYSGNGLKDYGNLIIIKHSDTYLTAYAHNKVNLVKDGATIKRGQKIAEMGQDDSSNRAVLHFELRKNGKPIDPFTLITKGQ